MHLAGMQLDLAEPLGRGGMGTVYAAIHPHVGDVVVKRLPGVAPDRRVELVDEIRTTAALDHPHIVRIHDVGVVDDGTAEALGWCAGDAWVAMDRSTHGTLADLALHTWPEVEAQLRPLLSALAHAHARGVVHLDVKPANVLLGGPTRAGPWLADFGIARVVGQGPAERRGTAGYMPPEQRAGRWRDLGPWSDLYALGRTALAVWTGSGHTPLADLDVPPALAAWLGRMVEPDLRYRFRHAAQALAALPRTDAVAPRLVAIGAPTATLVGEAPAAAEPAADGLPTALDPCLPPPADWRTPADLTTVPGIVGAGLVQVREPPLVGRIRERDALWAALTDAIRTRRPATLAVDGPVGFGATRLSRWLLETAAAVDAVVPVAAWCTPEPLGGLVAAARERLGATGLHGAELEGRVGALAPWLDGELPVGAARAAAADWLHGLTSRGPVLCVLDDAEADPAVPALLTHLAHTRRPEAPPVVVLAVRAPVEATLRVSLGPLAPPDHLTLVGSLLTTAPDQVREVATQSAGHPGHAVELVRARAAGRTAHGVEAAVAARLDALAEPLRRGLAVGACFGPVVQAEAWAQALAELGLGRADLASAVGAGLVALSPDGWTFTSGALVEAARATATEDEVLAVARSLGMRARAAELLESASSDDAVGVWLGVADAAVADADWAGADRAARRALACLDSDARDPRRDAALAVQLTSARRLADRTHTLALARAAIADRSDVPDGLALPAAAALAFGRDHAAATRLLEGLTDPAPEAYRVWAAIASQKGDLPAALAHLERAVAEAIRRGDPGSELRYSSQAGMTQLELGRPRQAVATLEAVAARVDDTPGADAAEALRWLAVV
ncbi:MAG: hypothetical protein ACI9K2_006979, partial [Myxococcota bacterium]